MFITVSYKKAISAICIVVFSVIIVFTIYTNKNIAVNTEGGEEPIRWVDFNASYAALCDTMAADIESVSSGNHISWIDMLSFLACKNGNNFSSYNKNQLTAFLNLVKGGETVEGITENLKYFNYYRRCFDAVLGGFLGEYAVQSYNDGSDELQWSKHYGLKVFSPIAKNWAFNHYDDFAAARSYGYKRKHTGHDLMGSIGTPVIAVESGIVENAGWNRYGGWRIGIRSFDKKRYYYYAHLRKDHPYAPSIKEGAVIKAGDVIGYLGMTGYSTKENVNNINVPHLHFGLQLIFDESLKDGPREIWVDVYTLVKFLQKNTSEVYRENGEFQRKYDFFEPSLINRNSSLQQ